MIQDHNKGSVETVLKEIKKRVKARLDLCEEIRQLETGNLPVFSSPDDPIPQKVAANLYKFTISSWKNYCSIFMEPEISKEDYITASDIFYEAILQRGYSK